MKKVLAVAALFLAGAAFAQEAQKLVRVAVLEPKDAD